MCAQLPEAHGCFGQLRGVASLALGRWLALPADGPGGALAPLPAPLEAAFAADITSSLAPKAQVWTLAPTYKAFVASLPPEDGSKQVFPCLPLGIRCHPLFSRTDPWVMWFDFPQGFVAALVDSQLRPSPPPGSPVAPAAEQRRLDAGLAAAAASACGTYFQLLRGSSFSRRIGQPLLTVLEKVSL